MTTTMTTPLSRMKTQAAEERRPGGRLRGLLRSARVRILGWYVVLLAGSSLIYGRESDEPLALECQVPVPARHIGSGT